MKIRTLSPLFALVLAGLLGALPALAVSPTAAFTVDTPSPTVGTGVIFNALASTGVGGSPSDYAWSFGDGAAATGAFVSHGFTASGTFTVSLTVHNGGTSDTVAKSVVVAAAPTPAPTHGSAVAVDITPGSLTLTADATQTYTASARDANGVTWPVTLASSWSENDPRGTLALSPSSVTYAPGKVGTWTISATYEGITGTAGVAVTVGAVAHVVVNPSTAPESVPLDASRQFTAEAFDADWNAVPGAAVTWTVGNAVGTVGTDGTFTPKTEGSGSVVASIAGITSSSAITVTKAAAEPVANPVDNSGTPTSNGSQNPSKNPSNGGTGVVAGSEDETPQETDDVPTVTVGATCSTLRWWGWLGILVAYLGVLYGVLYATRRLTGFVFWILPLALTAAALWGYFQYRCDNFYPWFPWLTVLGGLIVALFRPLPPEPPLHQPTASSPIA